MKVIMTKKEHEAVKHGSTYGNWETTIIAKSGWLAGSNYTLTASLDALNDLKSDFLSAGCGEGADYIENAKQAILNALEHPVEVEFNNGAHQL